MLLPFICLVLSLGACASFPGYGPNGNENVPTVPFFEAGPDATVPQPGASDTAAPEKQAENISDSEEAFSSKGYEQWKKENGNSPETKKPAPRTEAPPQSSEEAFSAPVFEETPDIRPLDRLGRVEDVVRAQGFMTARIVFSPASSELDERAKKLLSREVSGKIMAIIGNSSAGGDRQKNIDLSLARASAAADFLASQGHDLSAVKLIGKGPNSRYGASSTENRRATIVFQK